MEPDNDSARQLHEVDRSWGTLFVHMRCVAEMVEKGIGSARHGDICIQEGSWAKDARKLLWAEF